MSYQANKDDNDELKWGDFLPSTYAGTAMVYRGIGRAGFREKINVLASRLRARENTVVQRVNGGG
jgi:hypothetical protein